MPTPGSWIAAVVLVLAVACDAARPPPGNDPSTVYFVTYGRWASDGEVRELEHRIGTAASSRVDVAQLTRTMRRWRFRGDLPVEVKRTIQRTSDQSAIVCSCCEAGMGCLTDSSKPGCP
jgi:hypothetical protein